MSFIDDIRDKTRVNILGLGISGFDLFGTIIIAALIAKKMNWSYTKTIGWSLVIGEGIHLLLHKNTPITELLKKEDEKKDDDEIILFQREEQCQ